MPNAPDQWICVIHVRKGKLLQVTYIFCDFEFQCLYGTVVILYGVALYLYLHMRVILERFAFTYILVVLPPHRMEQLTDETWHMYSKGTKGQYNENINVAPVGRSNDGNAILLWWHRQMETCSVLLALCAGNVPITGVTGEFPSQRPVTRSLDIFLIYAWTNGSVNNRLRYYYVISMLDIKELDCFE